MKAALYRSTGPAQVLQVEEVGRPEPGPGEVLVRVHASGINPTDYKARSGAALTATARLLRQAEAIIRATPDVDSYSRRTGYQLGGGLTEADEGDFFIHLRHGRRRDDEGQRCNRSKPDVHRPLRTFAPPRRF